MESEHDISQPLVLVGLTLLIFLSLETFVGTTLNVEKVMPIDSTYIVALIDIALMSTGMLLGSSSKLKKDKGKTLIELMKVGLVSAALLFAGYMIMFSMAEVHWNEVEWFEPKLNFELIRSNLKSGLLVSQLLILVLVLIFAFQRHEHEAQPEEKTIDSQV